MTSELWESVGRLAAVWRSSSSVQAVSSVVPQRGTASTKPLTTMLEDLMLRGQRAHPLRFAREIKFLLKQPFNDHISRPDGYENWMVKCQHVEIAFLEQLAWLRAQTPGYPLLRVPQLVSGAPQTEELLYGGPPWRRSDMTRGLQLAAPRALHIGGERINAGAELRSVGAALNNSEPWKRLAESRAALTDADTDELRTVNQRLRAALAPERIAENTHLSSSDYRRQQLDEGLSSLNGAARVFADAFTDAASVVDFAIDEVFPQLVVFDRPRDINVVADLDWLEDETLITFITDDPLLNCGELRFVPDSMVEEVGQVIETQMIVEFNLESVRVTMRLIPGLAATLGL